MDSISEERLKLVHPVLAERIHRLDAKMDANSMPQLRVTQGLRTWNEQDALFNQTPKVTKAQGGFSAHNFGYAVDVGLDDPLLPGWQPDWNVAHPSWKQMLMLAKTCGLAEGAEWRTFPDYPHLYLEELPATPTEEIRWHFREGGLQAVWDNFRLGA
jgi:peptidoglycan L-alanyl-D-glutamate endopeptidase CwlK